MTHKDKTIAIIGGSSGIGLQTADLLVKKGFNVLIGSRNKIQSKFNQKFIDVTKEKTISKFFGDIKSLNGLIFSVGVTLPKSDIRNFNKKKYESLMLTNVTGALISIKYAYEKLKTSKGKIVIVNSVAARNFSQFSGFEYTISKSALSGLVRQLSIDFAEDGVLINSVFPSMTGTKLLYQNVDIDKLRKIEDKIPLKRIAQPEEIAKVIHFLVSSENTYITGSGLDINGGQFLSG